MTRKVLIIDDEKPTREFIRKMLESFDLKLEIYTDGESVQSGIEAIENLKPDIVLLDIQMPDGNGFDVLKGVSNKSFEIIFITAYQEFAVQAIKFSALDYLLKPINIEEVKEAVSKAKKRIEGKHTQNNLEHLINNLRHPRDKNNKIPISVVNGFQFVPVNTIVYCEADDDYTYIHLTDSQKLTVSKNIKEFEDILANYDFFRIHHSYLVNRDYIKKYVKGEGGTILTEQGNELPVSRRRKQEFLEWLSNF